MSPNHGGPPTKLPLKVMHLKLPPFSSERIHLKAPMLSHQARAHTYIKYNRGGFWYPYSIGSMGVSIFPNLNKFYLQNLNHLFYHNKIL